MSACNSGIWRWPAGLGRRLLAAVYPMECVGCGTALLDERGFCPGCLADLPRNANPCLSCGEPLLHPGLICARCSLSPPAYHRVFAPWLYRFPLDSMIQAFKFHQRLTLARPLAQLLGDALASEGMPLPQALIPVPLHVTRLAERGYNQSAELAGLLGCRFGLPVLNHGCERLRATPPMSRLKRRARRRQMRGAFALSRPLSHSHLALVDDVVTTGHTVNELARVLRAAGAERVDIWAIARTPGPQLGQQGALELYSGQPLAR